MTTNKPTEDVELTIRKMLNKLCHSNLGEVFQNFMRIQAQDDDLDHLTRLIVDIILNKVDINPGRAGAFVKLTSKCFYHKFNLRQEILDRCLVEFRSCMDNLESIDKSKLDRFKAKLIERSEGNIRLLGELFNYQVLNCKMIMECVDILFKRQDDLSVAIFCNLIRTIGHKLDKTVKEFKQSKIKCLPKLRDDTEFVHWIETLFEDLDARITSGYFLSLNSETAVQEVLQLRKNNWKTEEVVTTSKSRKNLNLQLAPRNIDNEASKDWVFAEFPKLMSGLVAEEDKTLDAMKAQPEKSRDTISPSSGESDVDVESIIRQMLNRVSHSNFDEVLPDFISIQADDIDHLASLVVDIMLSKLDRNPWRASVFARLISEWFRPKFDLRKGILKRCKAEFILCIKNMDMDAVRASGDNLEPIRQSELGRFKANIRLLGELYNYQALEDKKIMKYVDNLLKRHDGLSVTILCNLIRTIGRQLDKTVKEFTEEIKLTKLSFSKLDKKLKFVHGVENLFEDLRTRSNSEALSSSSITDLKEILQLRKNNWEREEASTTSLSSNKINWTLAYGVDLDLTIRQMLNKLSHSNFDEVFEEFSTSNCINGDDNLISLAVDIMMEKVAKKPTSAGVLAKLVSRSIDQFRTRTKRSPKLMKGILDQCQMKFQSCVDNLDKIKELEDNLESIDKSGLNILALELVKSNEGNIRLIGELCNHQMLIPRIIMECANVLLKNNHDMGVAILCDLIRTTGLTLDKKVKEIKENKSKKQSLSNLRNNMKLVQGVENFFEDLTTRSNGGYLPSNSITAVKGILELRKNNWKTEEGLTTSKLVVNGAVPIFKQRKIDNQIFVKLNNNVQSSSRMSTSSNSTSGALDEDDLVSKRFAELTGAMSSVKLTPYLATKKEEVFHSAKAKLEKSTDTISCSRGKSNTRHKTLMFYHTPNGVTNPPPGTVVDKEIVHQTQTDFYLCSHAGMMDPVAAPTFTGGSFPATWFGPSCMQSASGSVEAGCLTINVIAPANASPTNTYPVMVWIHGGGFQNGGSSAYFPQFMLDQNIVLVSMNYRLGVYGFLNAGIASARGNQGLKDQVLALKWVQNNILQFGGNKNKVTIFGESAGSMSVSYLLVSPMARGLFHGAIMQSGTFTSPFTYGGKLNGRQCAVQVGQAVGCPTNDMGQLVTCLQSASTATLNGFGNYANAFSFSEAAIYCGPSIETFATGMNDPKVFLDQDPWAMVVAGNYSKVPMIIGSISNTEVVPQSYINNAGNLAYLNANWDAVISDALYLAHNPTWFSVTQGAKNLFLAGIPATINSGATLGRMLTDRIFTHPVRIVGAEFSKSVPVFLYNFTHPVLLNGVPTPPNHASDLQFFFDLNGQNGNVNTPGEIAFSQAVVKAWATFADTKSPGQFWGGVTSSWTANTVTTPCGALNYAILDSVPSMQTAPAQSVSDCIFWTSLSLNEPGQPKTCPTLLDSILNPVAGLLPGGGLLPGIPIIG